MKNSILCLKKQKGEQRPPAYRLIRVRGDGMLIAKKCNVYAHPDSADRFGPEEVVDPARVAFVLPPNPKRTYND